MALTGLSSLTNDFEHFLMYLFDIHTSSLVKCLFKCLAHFLLGCWSSLLLIYKNSLHLLESSSCQIDTLQISFTSLSPVFSPPLSLKSVVEKQNILSLMKFNSLIFFSFIVWTFYVLLSLGKPKVIKIFSYVFLWKLCFFVVIVSLSSYILVYNPF